MNIKIFSEKLLALQPKLNDLLSEGYSQKGAIQILNNEYVLKPKDNQGQYDSILLEFLHNYDLEFFRIRNIFFDDILRYVNGYLLVGSVDSGYLGLDESTGHIYIIYADEIDNVSTLFVANEFQFFEVLLIMAEYSARGSEDEIEEYLERCETVCQLGNYDSFF